MGPSFLMDSSSDPVLQLGAYEPSEARRLVECLEQHGIPFELESDPSPPLLPHPSPALTLGTSPDDSKVVVFVTANDLPAAQRLESGLFSR